MVTLGVRVPLPGGDLVLHEEGRALQVVVGPGVGQQAVGPHLAQALQGLRLGEEDGGAPRAGRAAVGPLGAQHARAGVPRRHLPAPRPQRQPHQVRVAAVARAGRAPRAVVAHGTEVPQVRVLGFEPRRAVAPPRAVPVVGIVARRAHGAQRPLALQHGAVRPGAEAGLAVGRQRAGAVVAGGPAVAEARAAAVVVRVAAQAPAQVGQRGAGADVAQQGALGGHFRYAGAVGAAGSATYVSVGGAN